MSAADQDNFVSEEEEKEVDLMPSEGDIPTESLLPRGDSSLESPLEKIADKPIVEANTPTPRRAGGKGAGKSLVGVGPTGNKTPSQVMASPKSGSRGQRVSATTSPSAAATSKQALGASSATSSKAEKNRSPRPASLVEKTPFSPQVRKGSANASLKKDLTTPKQAKPIATSQSLATEDPAVTPKRTADELENQDREYSGANSTTVAVSGETYPVDVVPAEPMVSEIALLSSSLAEVEETRTEVSPNVDVGATPLEEETPAAEEPVVSPTPEETNVSQPAEDAKVPQPPADTKSPPSPSKGPPSPSKSLSSKPGMQAVGKQAPSNKVQSGARGSARAPAAGGATRSLSTAQLEALQIDDKKKQAKALAEKNARHMTRNASGKTLRSPGGEGATSEAINSAGDPSATASQGRPSAPRKAASEAKESRTPREPTKQKAIDSTNPAVVGRTRAVVPTPCKNIAKAPQTRASGSLSSPASVQAAAGAGASATTAKRPSTAAGRTSSTATAQPAAQPGAKGQPAHGVAQRSHSAPKTKGSPAAATTVATAIAATATASSAPEKSAPVIAAATITPITATRRLSPLPRRVGGAPAPQSAAVVAQGTTEAPIAVGVVA